MDCVVLSIHLSHLSTTISVVNNSFLQRKTKTRLYSNVPEALYIIASYNEHLMLSISILYFLKSQSRNFEVVVVYANRREVCRVENVNCLRRSTDCRLANLQKTIKI
jgi:hypothetical protein